MVRTSCERKEETVTGRKEREILVRASCERKEEVELRELKSTRKKDILICLTYDTLCWCVS